MIWFFAVSVLAHLILLAFPGWPTPLQQPLTIPPMQVSLQRPATSKPVSAAQTEKNSRRSDTIPTSVMAKPGPAPAGPAESAATPSAAAGEAERLNHLQTLLRSALDRQFVYPPLARRHGWQGKVELTMDLDTDGRLQNVHIFRSSGHAILDQDALATLARIGVLPQARGWPAGHSYRLALPVVYRLVEG